MSTLLVKESAVEILETWTDHLYCTEEQHNKNLVQILGKDLSLTIVGWQD